MHVPLYTYKYFYTNYNLPPHVFPMIFFGSIKFHMFTLFNYLLSIFIMDKYFHFFIFLFFVFINTYLSSLQLQTILYTIPWALFTFLTTLFYTIYILFFLKPPDTTQYLYHPFSYDYFLCTLSFSLYIPITVVFYIINHIVKTTLHILIPYCIFDYL